MLKKLGQIENENVRSPLNIAVPCTLKLLESVRTLTPTRTGFIRILLSPVTQYICMIRIMKSYKHNINLFAVDVVLHESRETGPPTFEARFLHITIV